MNHKNDMGPLWAIDNPGTLPPLVTKAQRAREARETVKEACEVYSNYQPTGFDPKGIGFDEDDDRQNWLVFPCSRTRDSGPLVESNFHSALKALGGEGEAVEVHRFGHWGPGWFELILFNPSHDDTVIEAADLIRGLDNYPVIDEMDYCEREHEEACEIWEHASLRDRIYYCQRAGISFLAARRDTLPEGIYPDHLGVTG